MSSAFSIGRCSWPRRIAHYGLLVTAGLLAACNLAASPQPLFSAADGAGQPALKPGLWALHAACDETQLFCRGFNAIRLVVEPSSIRFDPATPLPRTDPPPFHLPVAYVLAAGSPRVMQFDLEPKDTAGPPAAYAFFGFAPTAQDADGKITAANLWPVQCGPPPKAGDPTYDSQDDERYQTLHRLAGMIDSPVGDCAPRDRSVALRAAALSRTWAQDSAVSISWVSDVPPNT